MFDERIDRAETPRRVGVTTVLERQKRSSRGKGKKARTDAEVDCMHLNAEQAGTKCRQASSPRSYPFVGVVLGQCTELHLKPSIIVEVQQASNSTGRARGKAKHSV